MGKEKCLPRYSQKGFEELGYCPMNSDSQTLISRANTLVAQVAAKGGHRRCYPPELKSIVRALVLKQNLSVPQIIALIPISHGSVRTWSQKQYSTKGQTFPTFKKISVKQQPQNVSGKHLAKITEALYLLTVAQALLLAWNLFHQ